MKIKLLSICIVASLFFSCKNNAPQSFSEENYHEDYAEEQETMEEDTFFTDNQSEEAIEKKESWFNRLTKSAGGYKTHHLRDMRTGLIVQTSKYPSDWNVISKPIYTFDQKVPTFLIQIEGPNNLKTFNTPTKLYMHYHNPEVAQMVSYGNRNLSKMLRPEISSQQLFRQEVQQRMTQSGFSYVGERKLPKIKEYIATQIKTKGTGSERFDFYATQWKNSSGQSAIASVTKIAMEQPMDMMSFTMWMYTIDYFFVDEDVLEKNLDETIKAATNSKENPEWEQYMAHLSQQRQREAVEQMKRSNAMHRQNMANRQAAFNAHQEKMKGIWAAQDANHASFMNRNFGSGSDTGQKQFINMINEQETVYNPLTNKNYQVDAGSSEYWMDSNGNYIQNNDLFYTPNGDINLNNREWTKVKKAF
ncbi:hypothetical protein [Flagellimonas nanhaiensis]|uniref:Lipoprotein n=1 Tax=Flagellimonas nanhaiensis TaxID=2292706 RepID=A0A371JRR9_9FLAO|nr:hypothetical protein [Allomuricauda nanhaiensis]RDY60166.1 hypothetical protein DX873_12615 [Allomuricauda nanhaiensis]